ncbi:MAG: NAD-dependent dehydratase [Rhodospirillaceae bacterium]|nr:NAD-dependent dehydratase [Rhodospirillaceae bacterium]
MTNSDNEFSGKRVLVTGADGFIGSHLAEALVHTGAEVTALAFYNSFGTCGWLDEIANETRSAMHIELGDVRDGVQMRSLAEGIDIIFHLAALIGIPYSYVAAQSYVDVNIHGTLNLLEASRTGMVGRFIHTSTSEVYGSAQTRPICEDHPLHGQSPYAASKIGADQMVEAFVRSHGIPAVTLRPFNTFGPRQSERAVIPTTIRQMLDPACTKIFLGDLSTTRDFTFVGDTVRAFLALGGAANAEFGKVYNVGTGVEIKVSEVVTQLGDITGCNKPIVSEETRIRPEHSEVRSLVADATRLTNLSGWQPQTVLEDGLSRCIDWWRERIASGRQRRNNSYVR